MVQTLTAGDDSPPPHLDPRAPRDPAPVRVRPDSPAGLLSVVPHLLGFVPQDSLVVMGTEPPRDRVKVTLRFDLPEPPCTEARADVAAPPEACTGIAAPPEACTDVTAHAEACADIAAHAVAVVGSQRLTAMTAVGYGSEAKVTPMAYALIDAARQAGIDLRDVLRVENGRYWSYACGDEACCPAAGTPFDPVGDPASAALARAGYQVLPDRAALAARVAPVGGIAAVSMRQATRRAEQHASRLLKKVRKSGRLGAARQMIAAEGLNAVGSMIATYRDGGRYATEYQIAWITVALCDLRVRDDAWARMDPAYLDAHRRLWIDVTQRAQPGYVAAPASLLAFVAWQSGDGALANVALDRALADQPRYSMAQLLRQVITAGAPPSLARLPMTPEEVAASYDEAEQDMDGGYAHELDLDVHDPDTEREH